MLAGSCQIEVLGSNKQVGLAREARVNMAKVNLRIDFTQGTSKEVAIVVGDSDSFSSGSEIDEDEIFCTYRHL